MQVTCFLSSENPNPSERSITFYTSSIKASPAPLPVLVSLAHHPHLLPHHSGHAGAQEHQVEVWGAEVVKPIGEHQVDRKHYRNEK